MENSLPAFLFAFGAIALAEMGDKTQLLAMAFAARYNIVKVIIGIFIATIITHAMAVAVGSFIGRYESIQLTIQSLAALSFIFFGLWTLRGDKLEGEENKTTKFGVIATVTIAFFIAELGDKTQLATIALATKFPQSPIAILIGTTLGMLAADGLGILLGYTLHKKIPERKIKFISAIAFIAFGFIASFQILYNGFKLDIIPIVLIMVAIIIITGTASFLLIRKNDVDSNRPKST